MHRHQLFARKPFSFITGVQGSLLAARCHCHTATRTAGDRLQVEDRILMFNSLSLHWAHVIIRYQNSLTMAPHLLTGAF
jgi:hypothetical protein